jgi:hypothetical protein
LIIEKSNGLYSVKQPRGKVIAAYDRDWETTFFNNFSRRAPLT